MAVCVAITTFVAGCGLLGGEGSSGDGDGESAGGESPRKAVMVEMPWDTTAVRDKKTAPIVSVVVVDDGRDGVPVPHIYGYPLWAEGQASRGILKLRHDNYSEATLENFEDEHGVKHWEERLPALGCTFHGIEETEIERVPLSLSCELPAPAALGGKKRPVVGELTVGAHADKVVSEPSLVHAFLGDWHLVEGDLKKSGVGFFNTEHGQLAFEFERGRLSRVTYHFDPPEKRWRSAMLWVQP
ncbi:MAG: hypothetical protein OEZ06_25640 [Myxococcales bacterium]|nr:hypothetical protein [Myxococcales bacterium]